MRPLLSTRAALPDAAPLRCRLFVPLAPSLSAEDKAAVESMAAVLHFLAGGSTVRSLGAGLFNPSAARELLPYVPGLATQVVPELLRRLVSRITARALRELFA